MNIYFLQKFKQDSEDAIEWSHLQIHSFTCNMFYLGAQKFKQDSEDAIEWPHLQIHTVLSWRSRAAYAVVQMRYDQRCYRYSNHSTFTH